MSIQSISNDSSAALQWLLALTSNNTSQTSSNSSTAASALSTSASSASTDSAISGLAQLAKFFDKLESLAKTDPAAFKKLTAQISTELSDAAKQTSGDESTALQQLADRFKTASQTGSMDSLEPGSQSNGTSAYSSSDQSINPLALLALLASSTSSSGSSGSSTASSDSSSGSSQLNSLFQKIYNQVMQA